MNAFMPAIVVVCATTWFGLGNVLRANGPASLDELRKEKQTDAKEFYEQTRTAYHAGNAALSDLYAASIGWKNASCEIAANTEERIAALEAHRGRMATVLEGIQTLRKHKTKGSESDTEASATFWVVQAKVWVVDEQAKLHARSTNAGRAEGAEALEELRKEKLKNAAERWMATDAAYKEEAVSFLELHAASIDWNNASSELASSKQERIAVVEAHRNRMQTAFKAIDALYAANAKGGEACKQAAAKFWVAEAKIWVLQERAGERSGSSDAVRVEALEALRKEKLDYAEQWYTALIVSYDYTVAQAVDLYAASIARKNASYELAKNKRERVAALEMHLDRMAEILKKIDALHQAEARGGEPERWAAAKFWVAEAKVWVFEESAKP